MPGYGNSVGHFYHLPPEVACSISSASQQQMEARIELFRHGEVCFQHSPCERLRHAAVFPVFTRGMDFTDVCSMCMNHCVVRCINHFSLNNSDVCADESHKRVSLRRLTDAEIDGNFGVLSNYLVESGGVVKGRGQFPPKGTLQNNVETSRQRWSRKKRRVANLRAKRKRPGRKTRRRHQRNF